jgi:hypothetical protein
MLRRIDLQALVLEALESHDGRASIVQVAKFIWKHKGSDLQISGDLLYTWQYDMRWACTKLREDKVVKPAGASPRGVWELQDRADRTI